MIKNALRTFILSLFALWTLGAAGEPPYLEQVIEDQRAQVSETAHGSGRAQRSG